MFIIRFRPCCLALSLVFMLAVAPHPAQGQRGGPPHPETQALLDSGQQLRSAHDFDAAITQFTAALNKARALADRNGEAEALRQLGLIESDAGRPVRAIELTEQSLVVSRVAKDSAREAKALNNLGVDYSTVGQMDRALSYFTEALRIQQDLKNRDGEALALVNIGRTCYLLDQPERALTQLSAAQRLFKATGNLVGQATCLGNLGNVYLSMGEPLKALDIYRNTLSLQRELKDKRSQAGLLASIGNVHFTLGEPLRALGFYEQALTLDQEVKERNGEARILGSMGHAYERLGELDQALALYGQALPLLKAVGDRRGESFTLSQMGLVYDTIRERRKALECYRQALELNRQTSNRGGEASTLSGIGNVLLHSGQRSQARASFRLALVLHRDLKDRSGEAGDLGGIALACIEDGRLEEALAGQRQALLLQREGGDKTGEAMTLGYIAVSEKMLGRLDDAERHVRAALVLLEGFRAHLGGTPVTKIGFLKSHVGAYYRAIDVLLARNKAADAFAVTQQTKARTLLDLLADGRVGTSPRLKPEDRRRENELRHKADVLNARMVAEGVRNEVGAKNRFGSLRIDIARAEDALQVFTVGMYGRYPELARNRVARTSTLADVSTFLPPDTALLEYVVLQGENKVEKRDRTVLFVVTRRSHSSAARVHAYSLAVNHDQLALRVDAFHAACSDPRKAYAKEANALYRLLVAPAARQLVGKNRLLICPDGPLWDLPFAVLDVGRRSLLERFEIDYAYSATGAQAAVLAKTDKRRTRPTRTLLALANPDFGDEKRFGDTSNLPGQRPIDAPSRPLDIPSRPIDAPSRPIDAPSRPLGAPSRTIGTLLREAISPGVGRISGLPGTQREANALSRRFPGGAIYTGKEAQEQLFKEKAAGFRYIHLASHAFLNDDAPLLSSIVLANPPPGSPEDGFLTAREIFDLDLSAADLVVLSACNTARGRTPTGEGLVGLTWALFVAGAPTQVVSQWSVDDSSTATLMERFYAGLSRGRFGKGAVLRSAALSIMRDGKHGHPYYWAPFILIGAWRR